MLTGNRLVKIIFTAFLVILICINLYYFFIIDVGAERYTIYNGLDGHNHLYFHGFNWFLNKLGTFPGLNRFMDLISNAKKYIPDYNVLNPFENILTMLKLITFPFVCIGTLIVSIFENIIWMFSFFVEPVVI